MTNKTYEQALSNYNKTIDIIYSSTDFNRGYSTGCINILFTLYDSDLLDAPALEAILKTDFGFEDINLLRDTLLELIEIDKKEKEEAKLKNLDLELEEVINETNQE